jgi:hypothetical protein
LTLSIWLLLAVAAVAQPVLMAGVVAVLAVI